jgi:glycyl-tRNA synthetase beta chain
MPSLLLEIGTEELPAGFLQPATTFLQDALPTALADLRLSHGAVRAEATPRRLTVIVDDVAAGQDDQEEEVTGPKAEIAWDKDGKLSKAGAGFLRGRGLDESAAYKKETKKGVVMAAMVKEQGRPAIDVLPDALADVIGRIPFQKRMRWSDEKVSFGRPPRWLLCLLDDKTVPVSWGGLTASNTTRGHRFHANAPTAVDSVKAYEKVLDDGRVTLSTTARREQILERAHGLAKEAGGKLVEDEALLAEVANLVERPWPLLGRFEERFLDIPREILLSEMREHQKYFAVEDDAGKLLPVFIVVAGSEPADPEDVASGHGRVLRSRFEDGAFYFREDTKKSLADHGAQLASVRFHRDLGSIADKVARIERLAGWLAEAVGASAAEKAATQKAAALCKADLVSGVVGEFPELQGTMGRYYAIKSGEGEDVAIAIEESYAPRSASDALPGTLPGALVGVADRLDTIVGILGVAKAPKGSADPFGLRRAAIAVLNIAIDRGWRVSLSEVVAFAADGVADKLPANKTVDELRAQTLDLVTSRLRGVLGERLASSGIEAAPDIVDAAREAGVEDLADLDARTRALATMRGEDIAGFEQLAATFKRVGNILAKARADGASTQLDGDWPAALKEDAEKALLSEADGAREQVTAALSGDADYGQVLAVVAGLKPAVDRFFDDVMVMADDAALRQARLNLLARIEDMLLKVADFRRVQVDA